MLISYAHNTYTITLWPVLYLELLHSTHPYSIQYGGSMGAHQSSGATPTLSLHNCHCFYFLWHVARRKSLISKESDSLSVQTERKLSFGPQAQSCDSTREIRSMDLHWMLHNFYPPKNQIPMGYLIPHILLQLCVFFQGDFLSSGYNIYGKIQSPLISWL